MANDELPFPFLLDEAKKRPRNVDGTVGNRPSQTQNRAPVTQSAPQHSFVAAPTPDPEPKPQPDPIPKEISALAIDVNKISPLIEKVKIANEVVRQAGLDPNSTGGGIIAASIVEQLIEAPTSRQNISNKLDSRGVPALTAMAAKLKSERNKDCNEPKAAHIDKFRT